MSSGVGELLTALQIPINIAESLVWALIPLQIAALLNLFRHKTGMPFRAILTTGCIMAAIGLLFHPQCLCSAPRDIITGAIVFSLFFNLLVFPPLLMYRIDRCKK